MLSYNGIGFRLQIKHALYAPTPGSLKGLVRNDFRKTLGSLVSSPTGLLLSLFVLRFANSLSTVPLLDAEPLLRPDAWTARKEPL
jgi:hypothetical protein